MKKNTRNRRSVRFTRKFILAVGCVCLMVSIWFVSDKYFITRKLECYTQFGGCNQAITDKVGWLIGTHLLEPLPLTKVRDRLKAFIEIKNIYLYRRLPFTMVISLDTRKPAGLVGPQVLGTHVISDDEGFIIGQSDKANFPLLLSSGPVAIGGQLNSGQVTSLRILGQMNSLSEGQVVGKIEENQLSVYFPENFIVLMDLSHIASNWYTTLQVILTRSKILAKMPKVIDLRFSSSIVSF